MKDKSRDRYKLKGNSMEQILERTHLANRISSDNRARSDPQLTQKGESHAATGENLPFPVPTLPWLLLAFSRLCFPCLLALPAAAGNGRGREGNRAHYWAGFVAAARSGQGVFFFLYFFKNKNFKNICPFRNISKISASRPP